LFFYYFDRPIIIIVICLVDGGMPVMEGGTRDMLMVMNHVRHFKCFLKDYNQIHLMTVLFNRKIAELTYIQEHVIFSLLQRF
jgi:hypothetical protein